MGHRHEGERGEIEDHRGGDERAAQRHRRRTDRSDPEAEHEARRDDLAAASAELGFLFCALALISGMIWARVDWGAIWNWDPRQTSVMILLLIYGGYFTLRSAVPDPVRRGRQVSCVRFC